MNGPETNATTEPSTNSADTNTPSSTSEGRSIQPEFTESKSGTRQEDRGERESAGPEAAGQKPISELEAFQIDCLKCARYHEDRERFFSRIHRWMMFLVVCASSATIAGVFKGENQPWDWSTYSAIFTTIIGAADLAFNFSGSAKQHSSLRQRFFSLLADSHDTAISINTLQQKVTSIYADEPPCMHAVNAIAYNGAMDAYGRPKEKRLVIKLYHRIFRNMWSFTSADFPTLKEAGKIKLDDSGKKVGK